MKMTTLDGDGFDMSENVQLFRTPGKTVASLCLQTTLFITAVGEPSIKNIISTVNIVKR